MAWMSFRTSEREKSYWLRTTAFFSKKSLAGIRRKVNNSQHFRFWVPALVLGAKGFVESLLLFSINFFGGFHDIYHFFTEKCFYLRANSAYKSNCLWLKRRKLRAVVFNGISSSIFSWNVLRTATFQMNS